MHGSLSWSPIAALALLLGLAASPAVAEPAQLSRLVLPGTAQVDDLPITELSGLAWSDHEQILYAVSDQGMLLQFKIQVDGDRLTTVQPLHAFELSDPDDVVDGGGKRFNAEGLTVGIAAEGQPHRTELVAALEEKPPLIVRFGTDGRALSTLTVPSPVDDLAHDRQKGRGLESVTWSPRHGVMTAPESPLQDGPNGQHTVYAEGFQWSFEQYKPDSRLKGLDLLPNGHLLVLERSRGVSKRQQRASLRSVDLAACETGQDCPVQDLAVLPEGPENFEGMTLLAPGRVLLVSDNGGKVDTDTVFTLVSLP